MRLDERVRRLEEQQAIEQPAGPHILVDLLPSGGRLPAAERTRRIEEAKRIVQPGALVIVVDCPTCGENYEHPSD